MADEKEPREQAVETTRLSLCNRVWSFVFLMVLISLLGVHSPKGVIKVEVGQTALAVFQVAVTLYALLLTAATIVYTQIEKLRAYTGGVSISKYLDPTAKEKKIVEAKTSVEADRGKAIFAARCSLLAVLFSTGAMFTPPASCQPWPLSEIGWWIRVDYAILAAAIGLLLLSVLWLMPLILGFLDPGLMKDVDDMLGEVKKMSARGAPRRLRRPSHRPLRRRPMQRRKATTPSVTPVAETPGNAADGQA